MIKFVVAAALLSAPALASAEAGKPSDPAEKVRCKRQAETGSFAKVTKICRTEKQWRALRDASKEETRELQHAVGATRTSG